MFSVLQGNQPELRGHGSVETVPADRLPCPLPGRAVLCSTSWHEFGMIADVCAIFSRRAGSAYPPSGQRAAHARNGHRRPGVSVIVLTGPSGFGKGMDRHFFNGQDSPDIFLAMLAQRGFGSIRCQQQNREFFVTARRR